jgi:hypothetical protein
MEWPADRRTMPNTVQTSTPVNLQSDSLSFCEFYVAVLSGSGYLRQRLADA